MRRLFFLTTFVLFACGETSPLDGGLGTGTDAGSIDAAAIEDAGDAKDSGFVDAGESDGGTPDAGDPRDAAAPDAGDPRDAGAPDTGAGTPDAGACNYIEVSACIVDCMGYEYAHRFIDTNGACPDFYRLVGVDYPTIQAAIMGQNCNSTCIYKASTSVSFIDHCNRRNGYIIFRAPNAACPDLYEFSNGLFLSVADWEAATPCP